MPAQNGPVELPPKAPANYIAPLLLACLLMPEPPGNDIDPAVVEQLRLAILRGDPIPPVVAFPVGDGKHRLLFGMHRVEAARAAGRTEILAQILPAEPTPTEQAALQFRENNHRKCLSPLELASLVQRAMGGGLNAKAVARLFGISESSVSKALQIDRNLEESLKRLVAANGMTPKAAYLCSRLPRECQAGFWQSNGALPPDEFEAKVFEVLDQVGEKRTKERPVIGRTTGGLSFQFTGLGHEAVLKELSAVADAVRRLSKEKLPLSVLPQMLNPQ